MASKIEIIKPKTVKIYDLDQYEKLLKGVKVAACMLTESHQVVDEASVIKRLNDLTLNGATEGNCCSCCGVGPFESRQQQTAHYKHHWHTHNLKRKLFGKPPITFGHFNSRQDDDGSSVSGSDSEEGKNNEEGELFAAATRHCKAFFTNTAGQVFCVYRCALHHRKEELSTDGEGRAWVDRCRRLALAGYQRWAILMVSGGHFAGAIFAGSAAVVHKTFHSYVSRRGQGSAQVSRDQHGSAPRSAGASLRRYNQAQFLEHVQEIISGWAEDLTGCSLILYRAVGSTNQGALFGKNSPVSRDDLRVRALPFPTRKPTYKEVQRVHETVASLEVYETMELFQRALIASLGNKVAKTASDTSVEKGKKPQKGTNKPIDRAKSRERAPRELPAQMISSEDEGPCYIDSETPVDWIKTLSEQSSNGLITNSKKDMLKGYSSHSSESESEKSLPEKKKEVLKKKKKKVEEVKQEKKEDGKLVKKVVVKVPADVKNIWKAISSTKLETLTAALTACGSDRVVSAVNAQDPVDGNTALHKAAVVGQDDMVTRLLLSGSDPCARNTALQTPYAAADTNTRLVFRMFQADYPDMYNYSKSQIPGPITPELLEQEKERKAQQKRAKRQREKEKQAERIKTNKFLQLTDAEKVKAAESRCFLCGSSLPKTPFSYESYTFCTIKCLQNHKNVRPLHMSA